MNTIYQALKERYLSMEDDLIYDFYKPVMYCSQQYKRMAGYFSSNLINILYEELKETDAFENIKIKIICSPQLSNSDKEDILKGFAYKKIMEENVINTIDSLNLEDEGLPLITNLIMKGIIDIRFIVSNEGNGIFHSKEGIFSDFDNNKIAFIGSNNETLSAVKANFETTVIFKDTENSMMVDSIDSLFDQIWNNEYPNLYQIDITETIANKINLINSKINSQKKLIQGKFSILNKINLYPYQTEAIENWENNNYKGLFEMATGTGKTITALASQETLKKELDKLLTIIVVPQIDLVSQWSEEVENFGGRTINCNSDENNWKLKLKNEMSKLKRNKAEEVIVITTIETFKSKYFQKILDNYAIENSLLIADEVHTFAANQLVKIYDNLDKIFKFKLGVSATPFRKNETETRKLIEFFDDIIFSYSLEDAIKNKYLNEYEYYPIILSFSNEELHNYREGVANLNADSSEYSGYKEIEKVTSTIANVSSGKIYKLLELLKKHDVSNPKIVYCSPGMYNDGINIHEQRHIEKVQNELGNIGCKLRVIKSGVNAQEREEILNQFKSKDLDTLLAIKCLDQGVNLKSVTHAYILSSTDSLTEFIQRRGRILRIEKNKPVSKIYDLVMLPQDISSTNFYPSIEDAYLVSREMRRMIEYNKSSNNKIDNEIIIEEIQNKYYEVLEEYNAKARSRK